MSELRDLYLAVDPALYQPFGRFVVAFSALEGEIDLFAWTLLSKEQPAAQIALAGLSFSVKLAKFAALYRLRVSDPTSIERMNELRKAIEDVSEHRNRLLHSTWTAGSAPGTSAHFRYVASAKRGFVFESVEISAADINALADRCVELASGVLNLFMATVTPIEIKLG